MWTLFKSEQNLKNVSISWLIMRIEGYAGAMFKFQLTTCVFDLRPSDVEPYFTASFA